MSVRFSYPNIVPQNTKVFCLIRLPLQEWTQTTVPAGEYCRDRFMLTDRYPVEDMFLCQSGMPGWLSLGGRQLQNLVTNL